MVSTRRGRDDREDTDVAAAIAAVAEASNVAGEADTAAAAIAAVAAGSGAEADNTEAIDKAIFDFASSVELEDDENVVAIGAGGEISDGNGQGDGDGGGVAWRRVTKKRKSEMSGDELYVHFDNHLKEMGSCPNQRCKCVDVLADGAIRATVARYLCWFAGKTKYEQDSIVFEWFKYSALRRSDCKVVMYWFCLPYLSDGDEDVVIEAVRTHVVCSRGLILILDWGRKRWRSIRSSVSVSGVLPVHKGTGKTNYNSINLNERKLLPLMRHLEHLTQLGEVRATRSVATLVDGTLGHANRDEDDEAIFLPMSMGYRNCYKRYMASLGYSVRSTAVGVLIVERLTGEREDEPVDTNDFVSFPTYYYKWKNSFPKLKVSKPVEDICPYCYAFANRHRYLANRALGRDNDDDNDDAVVDEDNLSADNDDFLSNSDNSDDDDTNTGLPSSSHGDAVVNPEAAARPDDEERELMLLEAAVHIKMARAQRALYQLKVELAVAAALAKRDHSEMVFTLVVDYGQNMELPSYRKEQPGVTYYFSPLSVYNLGVVNHAHDYGNGRVSEHLHAHVYHEGVGKKGANNVSSLVIKTLRLLNIIREDSVGGELNIVFDNCSGQNKNNTVIRLAGWLTAMGYFKTVNFIFLIVGHTKNAADRLFNCLKTEYRRQNLFTFQALLEALNRSPMVTIHPTIPADFCDYDRLMNDLYRKLSGLVKKNHIFSCTNDEDHKMMLRQSDLTEHTEVVFNLRTKKAGDITHDKLAEDSNLVLALPIKNDGMNPYKMVEMYKNYRPNVPDEFQSDVLYVEPSADVWAKVKTEKIDRSEFRAKLKATKYSKDKERIESIALDEGVGKAAPDEGEGKA